MQQLWTKDGSNLEIDLSINFPWSFWELAARNPQQTVANVLVCVSAYNSLILYKTEMNDYLIL